MYSSKKNLDNINFNFNYFDKFLIINLEKDKERLQETINILHNYGVDMNKIVRIDAIYERWNGHLGCGKSHVKAIEYAINNNLENVIILEDDFNIVETNINKINKLIKLFIKNFKDWDVLDFTPCHYTKKDTHIDEISRLESGTCTTGYAVNKNYFKKLLQNRKESVKLLQKQTDNYLEKCQKENNCKRCMLATGIAIDQYQNKLQEKDNWYAFKNDIADQNRGGSTILSEKFFIPYK